MGGNITVGEYSAEVVDLSYFSPEKLDKLKNSLIDFFRDLNSEYKQEKGNTLWNDKDLVDRIIFSGSTRPLFQKSSEEYMQYKKKVGDIDVIVDNQDKESIHSWLPTLKGKSFGGVEILAVKESALGELQNHLLVQIPAADVDCLQVDFEYLYFENGHPTEFTRYSHYSSWEDIQNNIKGVFNKYLLRSLASSTSRSDMLLYSKKTKKPIKSGYNHDGSVSPYKFSVDYGIRDKYEKFLDDDGNDIVVDGKIAHSEKAKENIENIQEPKKIFKAFFGQEPKQGEEKDLFSFIRLSKLIEKYCDQPRKDTVFEILTYIMFGTKEMPTRHVGVQLDKDSLDDDIEAKLSALTKFQELVFTESDLNIDEVARLFKSTMEEKNGR